MKVTCNECDASYTIPQEKIPAGKAKAVCKKCGNRIEIDPGVMPAEQAPAEAALSSPAPPVRDEVSDEARALFAAYPELEKLPKGIFALREIFSVAKKGGYRSARNKLRVKILGAVSGILPDLLQENEQVLRVAHGVAYHPAEAVFGNGILTMLYNYYAILCTDRRVLFININSRVNRPTHYLFQMPYAALKKVKTGLVFGSFSLYPHKGKRRVFNYIKRYAAKELKQFIDEKIAAQPAAAPQTAHYEDICPSCFTPITKGLTGCPHCQAGFKTPAKAALRSLVLPGLGDMYLGHRFLGSLELIGSLVVLSVIVSMIASGAPEGLTLAVIVFLFYNGFDGALTYYMGKKGYVLAK